MIEYGKYHILEGIYPHIGLHTGLLADGIIHNIKLIYRYSPNNDHPVKTLLTFCGVYHGSRPDIKGNPPYNFKHLIVWGVFSFAHINEMMWIQKQHFFEIRLLVQTYLSIYRSRIDMILKVTSNFKIP